MDISQIGKAIRKLRTDKKIGLRELGRKVNMSPASILAIEKGTTSPTLASLDKILKAIGSDLAQFFTNSQAEQEKAIYFAKDTQTISDPNRTYAYLIPKSQSKKFVIMDELIKPSEQTAEWEIHDYDLAGTILAGGPAQLEIQDAGTWKLKKGDTFYVKANQKHRLSNVGKTALRQITISESKS